MTEKYPSQNGQWSGGKGSKRRPENNANYREGYDRVFGKKDKEDKKDDRRNTSTGVH